MANNFVYVFKQKDSMKYSWCAEIRSYLDKSNKNPSKFKIMMKKKSANDDTGGQTIKCAINYIKDDIPVVVLFRALGYVPDREILNHICYDT